jgi:hypothetical protein
MYYFNFKALIITFTNLKASNIIFIFFKCLKINRFILKANFKLSYFIFSLIILTLLKK